MEATKFLKQILTQVTHDLEQQKTLLDQTRREDISNDYWLSFWKFYHGLDADDQLVLLRIVKQANIDATASILNVIDQSTLCEHGVDLVDSDGNSLSGDLMASFWELVGQ